MEGMSRSLSRTATPSVTRLLVWEAITRVWSWRLGLQLMLLALLSYNYATLERVPAWLNDDDGAYAAAAYQFWRTGEPGIPGYKEVAGFERRAWSFGQFAAAVQGLGMLVGGVSIYAALLPSFLISLGLVAMTGLLGRALWNEQTGWLAALLLAASGKFFLASHSARPDLLLALCFVTALWLVAATTAGAPERNLLLAGFVMGLACDVHLNGFLLAPVPLLFWLLLRAETRRARWRGALLFIGAGTLGGVFWVATHYWPRPDEFSLQMAIDVDGLRLTQLGLWGALQAEATRYADWFWAARGHRHLLEGLCVLGGAWWLWRREGQTGRALVSIWAVIFLIGAALMNNSFGWYLLLVWPLFAVWMARAFMAWPRRWMARAALGLLLGAYLLNLGLWHFKARGEVTLPERVAELRSRIPKHAPVLANGALWFAFWDRDFTDDYYLKLRALVEPDVTVDWVVEQRRRGWQYIVAYGDLRRFLDAEIPIETLLANEVWQERRVEILAARRYAREHCSVVERLPGVTDEILVLRVNETAAE
jgi:4-amino-4-deoxy-L-arabinose transferase-like glycosyltransferase